MHIKFIRGLHNFTPACRANHVVTIGSFDGLHLGHRMIIKKTVERAHRLGIDSLVVTFDSHPRKYLKKEDVNGYMTALEDKAAILSDLGVDNVWFMKASSELFNMSAHNFLSFLGKYFFVHELVAGDDFRFGKDAIHGAHTIDKLAHEFNFKYHVLKKKVLNGNIISSSLLRRLLIGGDVTRAARLLARPYALSGKVVSGKGKGRTFGFPTANVAVEGYLVPGHGVYAGRCRVGKKIYPAAINIGNNPTFNDDASQTVEAHIIDFKKNITGLCVELFFDKRLREEKKFSSITRLISAISSDVKKARTFFCQHAF